MNRVSRLALVVASGLVASTYAFAADEAWLTIALANAQAEHADVGDYAARFATERGESFSISLDGDRLALEAPESWNLPPTTLHVENGTELVALDGSVRVTLADVTDGVARSASIRTADGLTARGERILVRGIVTIEDANDDAVPARPARRGVVTIEDVETEPARTGFATIRGTSGGLPSAAVASAE